MPTAQIATENLGNLSYGAMIKEATPGTPLTPTIPFYFYKSTLNTDIKLDEDNPIAGVRTLPYQSFMGQREHGGTLEVLAEPITARNWFDMLLAIGNVSGGGDPYTWPFTEGLSNSYTIDILKGQVVERYFGCMAEDIECAFDKNKGKFTLNISALGSFIVRKIKTVLTTTITLDTDYDPAPTKGLVASDLVRIAHADESDVPLDTTISSVNADGITLTLGASAAAFAAGDLIYLRKATQTYTLPKPFNWARTQFCFGTSAAAALSATQLQLETGSKFKITHKFSQKGGEHRSGSYDPAKLVRLQTEADLDLKMFFDQPLKLAKYLGVASTEALVIRMYEGTSHELRLTFNRLVYKLSKRELDSGKIIYEDLTGKANYNTTDGQGFDCKVLNSSAS